MRKMKVFSVLLVLCLPLSTLLAHNGDGGEKKTDLSKPFLAQEAMDESWFQAQPANCHPAACTIKLAPGTEMSEVFIPAPHPTRKGSPANQGTGRKAPVFEDHTVEGGSGS